ncbi:hypothetical protein MT1_3158 [Pseudomonas sp. MT-1]|uniref:hypothetical protein n=1 Tax=Stutzerimonas stutzeri TaxID=316 RepID=UPI000535B628|nr:hypothetical protein [Stutzerimonas stutzeri]MCQ4282892.1 hypothetical protein [Stutzerimonas stutzeri]BAP80333.1 hypothetical protein MT1_3158 [Pseudomonas sp. MT-1]|tara:strand:+ start:270 stop:719 length:450 start_codon:yes stop_codon:yes gene_type:complete
MKQARTLSENRIARDLGEALCRRMVGGCIRDLQRMQGHMLSGDDSGLINTWDEICVQQQIEHSFSWHAYAATMDALLEHRVSQLRPYELDALWLLTPQGDDWDCELEDERETYPVSEHDVVDYLQDELLTEAANWSNARISSYLERGYD